MKRLLAALIPILAIAQLTHAEEPKVGFNRGDLEKLIEWFGEHGR